MNSDDFAFKVAIASFTIGALVVGGFIASVLAAWQPRDETRACYDSVAIIDLLATSTATCESPEAVLTVEPGTLPASRIARWLRDPDVGILVVEHRDRLARFGVEYLEASLAAQGRSVLVMNENEQKLDLVQDFVDVVTSMCARIYGQRSAGNRAKAAIAAAEATS